MQTLANAGLDVGSNRHNGRLKQNGNCEFLSADLKRVFNWRRYLH